MSMDILKARLLGNIEDMCRYVDELEDYLLSGVGIKEHFFRCPNCDLVEHVDGKHEDRMGDTICERCFDKQQLKDAMNNKWHKTITEGQ